MALPKNPKHDLRRKYKRTLEVSFILTLAFLIVAFKYFPEYETGKLKFEPPPEFITVEDVKATKQKAKPPAPLPPPIPIEAPAGEEVMDDIFIGDTDLDVDADVEPPKPPKLDADADDEEQPPFRIVEELPQPIGGLAGIQKRITYPEIARKVGIHGMVIVDAIVDKDGNVIEVSIVKGIGGGCDEAAMEAVRNTKFIPGKQRGKPVKVQMTLPVRFRLN